MEGYGCPVWCVTCWIDYRETNIRQGRLKAKRGQNKQIQRMVKRSNLRIRLAEAGENVLIPIPTLDRRLPFDPQYLPGVILEIRDDGMHRIGTAAGALELQALPDFLHLHLIKLQPPVQLHCSLCFPNEELRIASRSETCLSGTFSGVMNLDIDCWNWLAMYNESNAPAAVPIRCIPSSRISRITPGRY